MVCIVMTPFYNNTDNQLFFVNITMCLKSNVWNSPTHRIPSSSIKGSSFYTALRHFKLSFTILWSWLLFPKLFDWRASTSLKRFSRCTILINNFSSFFKSSITNCEKLRFHTYSSNCVSRFCFHDFNISMNRMTRTLSEHSFSNMRK